MATALIATIFNAFLKVLLLCIVFAPLREYAGGYHETSRMKCVILSSVYMLAALVGIKFLMGISYTPYYIFCEIVCAGIIFRYAPLATENRKISNGENRFFKKVTRIILGVESIIGIISLIFENQYIMSVILMAHIGVALSLLGELVNRTCIQNTMKKKADVD